MRWSPHPPRSPACRGRARGWSRARTASGTLARVALVCYLMPVILLVFAIGGLAIGAGRLWKMSRWLADSLPGLAASMRGLVALPSPPRETGLARGPGGYHKPRSLR